jgi:hypothetical protein
LFDVKGGAVLEHEVKCPPELIGHDGVGLELSLAGAEVLVPLGDQGMMTTSQPGGLADGPAQIGIAELGAAQSLDLAPTGPAPAGCL